MIKIVSNTGNNQTHCFKTQGLLKKTLKRIKTTFFYVSKKKMTVLAP